MASAPRTRRLPFLVASFVIVGVLVVGVASLQAVVSQGSFRMQELARHNLQLQQDYGRLKLQVAELSSPGRIATEARRMGFHVPQPGDVRSLPVKGSVSVNAGADTRSGPALSLKSVLERRP
jgi:cell division protein FtsL